MVCNWPENFSSGGKNDSHPESRPVSNTASCVYFILWASVCAQHCAKSSKGYNNQIPMPWAPPTTYQEHYKCLFSYSSDHSGLSLYSLPMRKQDLERPSKHLITSNSVKLIDVRIYIYGISLIEKEKKSQSILSQLHVTAVSRNTML